MYASRGTQLIVGLFALAGIAALAYLSLNLGKVEFFTPPSYILYADFDNVSGLKVGDGVQIAGVPVGKVISEKLDKVRARVGMRINQGVQIDDEAIASIKSSGIIGDKYLAIALGPGDKTLENGGVIRQTESSFVLEDAIGQLINNLGSRGGKKDTGSGGKSADDIH
jgi:phospholipid/cholesterol/gamma-HCH transport system substrate-binding protein